MYVAVVTFCNVSSDIFGTLVFAVVSAVSFTFVIYLRNAKSNILCVFVIIKPVVASPVISFVYPVGNVGSDTVYVILFPFEYTGKSVNVYFQLFASFNVIVFPFTAVPSANKLTLIELDLFPSWLLLSFQIFSTET